MSAPTPAPLDAETACPRCGETVTLGLTRAGAATVEAESAARDVLVLTLEYRALHRCADLIKPDPWADVPTPPHRPQPAANPVVPSS